MTGPWVDNYRDQTTQLPEQTRRTHRQRLVQTTTGTHKERKP